MADSDQLSSSLQESILTGLAFSEDKRASLLATISPEMFEEPYRDLAARIIQFRERFGKPPGREHIDDLFDHVIGNPKDRRQQLYTRLLMGLIDQSEGLNIEYVVSRVTAFIRQRTLKGAIQEAADLYEQVSTRDDVAERVEEILSKALNTKLESYDAGTFMDDETKALGFLDSDDEDYLAMGIPMLDNRRICPVRKELIMFMGPQGSGKSWWCINLCKQATRQRWRTLYVSLEMSEKRILQRLCQSFFVVAKRDDAYTRMSMQLDHDNGTIIDLHIEHEKPKRTLRQNDIRHYLKQEMKRQGARLHNIVIKQFPSGGLTIRGLEAYMDQLEAVHNFVPDLLIVDYPDLMHYDRKNNPVLALGEIFILLRGMGISRNMAVAAPTQVQRAGQTARRVRGNQVAGDISKMGTCDNAITYSATLDERQFGMARLFAEKGRNDEDKFTVLIAQDYHTGQFVLQSAMMSENKYFDLLKEKLGHLAEDEDEAAE